LLLKELEEEVTYLYHPDHLGSVSVVSNQRGLPYERVEYLPFGEIWIEETDPATGYIPFRFTSKELDEETGLYYHGARYYEPTISRWMSADPAGWVLINLMDEDGELVPDGWPEGFGPGPSVGMKPDYSIIEAVNWYAYVSNNPVKYVDPTGMADWNAVGTGLLKMVTGTAKTVLGAKLIAVSIAAIPISGGTATPAAVTGLVVGGVFILDGQVKVAVGFGLLAMGLLTDEELDVAAIEDMPDSLSELLGMSGDEIIEGFTGKESDLLQSIGEWIGSLPIDKLDLLLNPTDLDAPTLEDQEVKYPPPIDTNTEDPLEE